MPLRLMGYHLLLPLSQLLHFVGLSLSRSLHSSNELLVCPINLLLLNGDLLLPLHHLDLNLLQTDLLLLLGCLQLVCQLGFGFLKTSNCHTFEVHTKLMCFQHRLHIKVPTLVLTSWLKDAFCSSSSRLESAILVSARNLTSIISFLHSAS